MFIIMTVADMFRPAMFVSWLPIQNRESHQVINFSSISGEFRFCSRTALGGLIIMNKATADYSG
jgi:hypothetical protein